MEKAVDRMERYPLNFGKFIITRWYFYLVIALLVVGAWPSWFSSEIGLDVKLFCLGVIILASSFLASIGYLIKRFRGDNRTFFWLLGNPIFYLLTVLFALAGLNFIFYPQRAGVRFGYFLGIFLWPTLLCLGYRLIKTKFFSKNKK